MVTERTEPTNVDELYLSHVIGLWDTIRSSGDKLFINKQAAKRPFNETCTPKKAVFSETLGNISDYL